MVLFDIDGTLIRAARRREYRQLTREMLIEVFGTCGRIAEVDFAGKTDLLIYREALECEGITLTSLYERLPILEAAKIGVIAQMARSGKAFEVCSGVRELLDAIRNSDVLVSSLLTGNLERLAEEKLKLVDLWQYFTLRGAFGSDNEDRDCLPAIAADRICKQLGCELPAGRFVVVGDTPRDISCARHFGARVVAVASGQHTVQQLDEHRADAVIQDLSDTATVINILERV